MFGALVFAPLIIGQFAAQIALTFPSLHEMREAAPGEAPLNAKIFEAQMRGLVTAAYVNIGIYLLGALLLLAAAARRLHDRGRSGWWALILPLGLFTTGVGQAERVAEAAKRMPAMLAEMERNPPPILPRCSIGRSRPMCRRAGPTGWLSLVPCCCSGF